MHLVREPAPQPAALRADAVGETILRDLHRLQEILEQDFAGDDNARRCCASCTTPTSIRRQQQCPRPGLAGAARTGDLGGSSENVAARHIGRSPQRSHDCRGRRTTAFTTGRQWGAACWWSSGRRWRSGRRSGCGDDRDGQRANSWPSRRSSTSEHQRAGTACASRPGPLTATQTAERAARSSAPTPPRARPPSLRAARRRAPRRLRRVYRSHRRRWWPRRSTRHSSACCRLTRVHGTSPWRLPYLRRLSDWIEGRRTVRSTSASN